MEWDGIDLREGMKLLDDCYERLWQVIQDEESDPKEIPAFVDEAEQIVVLITSILQKEPNREATELELMQAVKARADAIVQLLQTEMKTITQQVGQISTGRQAINAYNPQPVGFGYSEGKFVDRKK